MLTPDRVVCDCEGQLVYVVIERKHWRDFPCLPRLSEQSSNAFDLVHPCLPFFHILSGLDFTLAQQGCKAISCDQQVIWFKFRQVARCFPGIQPLLPWIICNISLNIHQQGSPSLSTSSMKLTLQKLCYGSFLNLDVIVAHDSKLAHQNQWLQLVYPDFHVFLQFLSIKSDKKKLKALPQAPRESVEVLFARRLLQWSRRSWPSPLPSRNRPRPSNQTRMLRCTSLTLQAQTRNFRGLTSGGLRPRCISRYRLWLKKAAWIWLVTTLHCVTTSRQPAVFHRDMTCLCNKNPLGFQCHISQQLVGNNVCPNCCSKSPTTEKRKKKRTTTAPWKYLNFVYFKVGEKEFKNWSIANPNSCSTCGTNDLPSAQVFASYESPSSSAAAKLSRSLRTRSAGPHPWRRSDRGLASLPQYAWQLCLCP